MSENHEIVMQAKHIVKQFPASRGRTLTACNDINLTMYKGKTLGIVGESGCGKSTFVRMVTSLENPTSGEILYHGKNITGLSKKETWENRQNLQMVFQDPMAWLMMLRVHTGKLYADLYISQITAMLLGRVLSGVCKALLFAPATFSIAAWATASFVTGLPGIIIQLVLLPSLVVALTKARLLRVRYA